MNKSRRVDGLNLGVLNQWGVQGDLIISGDIPMHPYRSLLMEIKMNWKFYISACFFCSILLGSFDTAALAQSPQDYELRWEDPADDPFTDAEPYRGNVQAKAKNTCSTTSVKKEKNVSPNQGLKKSGIAKVNGCGPHTGDVAAAAESSLEMTLATPQYRLLTTELHKTDLSVFKPPKSGESNSASPYAAMYQIGHLEKLNNDADEDALFNITGTFSANSSMTMDFVSGCYIVTGDIDGFGTLNLLELYVEYYGLYYRDWETYEWQFKPYDNMSQPIVQIPPITVPLYSTVYIESETYTVQKNRDGENSWLTTQSELIASFAGIAPGGGNDDNDDDDGTDDVELPGF